MLSKRTLIQLILAFQLFPYLRCFSEKLTDDMVSLPLEMSQHFFQLLKSWNSVLHHLQDFFGLVFQKKFVFVFSPFEVVGEVSVGGKAVSSICKIFDVIGIGCHFLWNMRVYK